MKLSTGKDVCTMIRQFGGLGEIVEDFEAAVRFYRDTLGLEVTVVKEGYAKVEMPGLPHLGIWERGTAAEATFGSADAADRIPLGYSIALFATVSAEGLARRLGDAGADVLYSDKGMVVFLSASGGMCEAAGAAPQAGD